MSDTLKYFDQIRNLGHQPPMSDSPDYKLLNSSSSAALAGQVNKLLLEGYVLFGNPFAAPHDKGCVFCQAMVKSNPDEILTYENTQRQE